MSTLQGNTTTIENLLRSVNNLPNVGADDAVLYIDQTLTDAQKAQARTNIGAASAEEVAGKMDKVTGTPDQVVGFDEAGNPVAREAPSGGGGVSSWNDLTDKPVVSGGGDTLTWDGNTDGRVVATVDGEPYIGYKISDAVITKADLSNGFSITMLEESEEIEETIDAETALSFAREDGFIDFQSAVYVPFAGYLLDSMVSFPEAGLYFMNGYGVITTSLTINGYTGFGTCEKFDPSYLYQPDWNQTDTAAADFIKNKPSSMTPSAHNQAASTITAGTFAGQVVANASGQAPGTSLVRNSKLVATEETPTVNGEIFWTYG